MMPTCCLPLSSGPGAADPAYVAFFARSLGSACRFDRRTTPVGPPKPPTCNVLYQPPLKPTLGRIVPVMPAQALRSGRHRKSWMAGLHPP
jgi:hypothetical protein